MDNNKYTTLDIAKELNVSDRTIRRYIEREISKIDGKYSLSEDAFHFIKNKYSSDNQRTTNEQPTDNEDDLEIVEAFSQEEYLEFQKD